MAKIHDNQAFFNGGLEEVRNARTGRTMLFENRPSLSDETSYALAELGRKVENRTVKEQMDFSALTFAEQQEKMRECVSAAMRTPKEFLFGADQIPRRGSTLICLSTPEAANPFYEKRSKEFKFTPYVDFSEVFESDKKAVDKVDREKRRRTRAGEREMHRYMREVHRRNTKERSGTGAKTLASRRRRTKER